MPDPDPIAIERHRAFGARKADEHFAKYSSAQFTTDSLLPLMREAMADTAANHGIGSRGLEPLVHAAADGFLDRWRELAAVSKS